MSSAWTHGTCYMANVNNSEQYTTSTATRAFILNSIMLMCNVFYLHDNDTQLSRLLLFS